MDKILIKRRPVVLVSAVIAGVSLVAALLSSGLPMTSAVSRAQLELGGKIVDVEIVSSPEDTAKGLSGRKSLENDKGMLFDFGDYGARTFWMKDMNFPLDIIWISEGKVVGIEKNALPEGDAPKNLYNSPGPVNQILEVNAGWSDANEVMVGTAVSLVFVDKK